MSSHISEQPFPNADPLAKTGLAVVVLYLFSGVIGLAYQILWVRMLSLQFGVSIFGVVIAAAAFMAGLGLGSMTGSQWRHRIKNPLKVFAVLEMGVAIYALLTPGLFNLVDSGVTAVAPDSLVVWYGLQLSAALCLITLPAFAMGVGFPMVLQALEATPVSLARLYGVNTCGGALGALLPLVLMPLFGWSVTMWSVALMGVTVAIVAIRLSPPFVAERSRDGAEKIPKIQFTSLLAYAFVGAAALLLEIGWTRLFGMLLLRTEYVMAVILAVFLLGIGGGSLLARYLVARWWFELLPLLTALFALLSLWAVPLLAAWAEQTSFNSLWAAIFMQGSAIASLTLPVTLLLGAWLPLLSARFGTNKLIGARFYGANSIGGALGALTAGLILLPWLGTNGTIICAALCLFVAGMVWTRRRYWVALPGLLLIAWPVAMMFPVQQLLPVSQRNSADLMVHEDALAITHVVEREDGQRLLLADLQRMDASSEPLAVISQQNQVRLPLMLHPQPESVLFLGLGTGISAAASLDWPNLERTAVELSQGSINAARHWFAPVNKSVVSKMTIVRDDARRYLKTSDKHFDVIVGDLFHPDLVGRSALLSTQQFERAKRHLNPGGVFVQWLALNQFDPDSLQVIMRTFQQVFPGAVAFVDGFRLALVGGQEWQPTATAVQANIARLDKENQETATGGEGVWSWLGRYWGPLPTTDGPLQDEWAPVIEYQLPQARYRGEMDLVAILAWLLQQRPHWEQARQILKVSRDDAEYFERGYVATELGLRAWVAELKGEAGQGQRLLKLAYQANPRDRWISGTIADRMYAGLERMAARQDLDRKKALKAILGVNPDHVSTIRALWRIARAEGNAELAEKYRQRLQHLSPLAKIE